MRCGGVYAAPSCHGEHAQTEARRRDRCPTYRPSSDPASQMEPNPSRPTTLDMRTPAADLILTLQRNNTARWFGAQAVRVAEAGCAGDGARGIARQVAICNLAR